MSLLSMRARLQRIERLHQPDPGDAPVRFTIHTGEDDVEDPLGADEDACPVRRFTIRIDRAYDDEAGGEDGPADEEERADA